VFAYDVNFEIHPLELETTVYLTYDEFLVMTVPQNKHLEENSNYKINIKIPEKSTVKIILKEKINTTVTGGEYSWVI
jgi:hypothetical protein